MRAFLCLGLLGLGACASVSFKQLEVDLDARARAPEGAVYYLPKPYLMVAQLPSAAPAAANSIPVAGGEGQADDDRNQFPDLIMPAGGAESGGEKAAAPSVGTTDLSFGAATDEYIIKLVYLPDRSRPMSMSVTGGLFGVGELKPTLANGWMLTGFEASSDNTAFADVLTAVAGVITAGKPEGSDGGAAGGGSGEAELLAGLAPDGVLRPGLYDFQYDDVTGHLKTLCAVTFFTSSGATGGNC